MRQIGQRLQRLVCLMAPVLACLWPHGARAADPGAERKIQAAFLLNFARYVEWPTTALSTAETPVCIGVLGDDPFGNFLDETVRGETIRGRNVVVRRERAAESLRDCHIVFISTSEQAQEAKVLAIFAGKPVLTVGDNAGFAQRGGVVHFFSENDRVRFEISRGAYEKAGLKVSPQLLRLARLISADQDPPPTPPRLAYLPLERMPPPGNAAAGAPVR
jgi:hypothetical protein